MASINQANKSGSTSVGKNKKIKKVILEINTNIYIQGAMAHVLSATWKPDQ